MRQAFIIITLPQQTFLYEALEYWHRAAFRQVGNGADLLELADQQLKIVDTLLFVCMCLLFVLF